MLSTFIAHASLWKTARSVLCSFGLSPQQLIYVLYESIATTELKGYIMMQFSYMLLKTQGQGMGCLHPILTKSVCAYAKRLTCPPLSLGR